MKISLVRVRYSHFRNSQFRGERGKLIYCTKCAAPPFSDGTDMKWNTMCKYVTGGNTEFF